MTRPTDASIRWAYFNGPDQSVRLKDYRPVRTVLVEPETTYCEADACENVTRYLKPYCLAHIRLMPYVSTLDLEKASDEAGGYYRKGRAALLKNQKRARKVALARANAKKSKVMQAC